MAFTEIDANLLDAWDRIGAKCRADRREALRRARRRLKSYLAHPHRAWCLALRACDKRIGTHNACFDFPRWEQQDEEDPTPREEFISEGESPADAIKRGVRHALTLTGTVVRELNKPVEIPWPGKTRAEIARMLGRDRGTIETWIDRSDPYPYSSAPVSEFSLASGRQRIRKGEPVIPPLQQPVLRLWGHHYAGIHGAPGMPIAIVYAPSPIDPNHAEGRPPDPVWGTFWQWMWKEFPEDFEQTFERTALWGTWKGKRVQRGWRWTCPGLADANGAFTGCGRPARMLYAPIPIRTLGEAIPGGLALEMPEDSGLAGQWHPGRHDTPVGQGSRAFACRHCWNVQFLSLTTESGWGQFVSYISGGLLYGKEVARPVHEAPLKRKNRYAPQRRPIGPRRQQVLDRLLVGKSVEEIAAEFDLTKEAIRWHIKNARLEHDAKDVEELLRKVRAKRAADAKAHKRAAG